VFEFSLGAAGDASFDVGGFAEQIDKVDDIGHISFEFVESIYEETEFYLYLWEIFGDVSECIEKRFCCRNWHEARN
jgi:hypothetical protein